jgi:phenylalanyl-tRNA synthetase beta chain
VDIASNRGDCLNYIGIAREIGAKIYKTLKYPNINYIRTERKQKKYQSVNLKICIQSNLCYRYIGTIVTGVKVSNSPSWLVEILNKSDIRSVNNIVDITNYVMLETGQPLHAFDLNNVYSKDFILRKALNQEEMIGIDNKRYLLNSDNLILSTRNNIISIAGIIGSKDFSVNSNTKSIFLESAIFDPITIRRTAKDLNIISQASYRFERNGTDWNMVNFASLRALKLIRKLSGGTVELRVDIKNTKLIKHNILLNCDKLYKLLGYYISKEDILEVLKYLGIKTIQKNNTDIKCSIPYWRNDIMEDVDLIEEISRIKGYDLIPYSYSLKEQTSDNNNVKMKQKLFPDIVQNMRRRLKCFGFNEVLNSSFIEKSDLNKFSLNYYHKIINPRAKENEILRPSLLPSIYKNLLLNLNHGVEHISLFEYGKIFNSIGENKHFAIIMYGAICEEWWKWNDLKLYPKYDFYFCGGLINHIISLKQIEFKTNSHHETYYHQGQVTSIFYKSNIIGQFGLLDPHLTENDNIHGNVFYCEIDIDAISHISLSSNIMYMQYSKFPFIKRDISIVADKTLPFSAIDKVIKYVIKKSIILKKYSLFSVYSDVANLGKNKKSYSIRLLYQHPHKTLTNKEVDQNIQYLLKKLNNSLDIKLRQS